VTGTDPKHLADPTEAQRDQAMARWQVLRPHIEDGVPLARLAGHGEVADRTLQRWAARYRTDGLAGLARRERADLGARPNTAVTSDCAVIALTRSSLAPTAAQILPGPAYGRQPPCLTAPVTGLTRPMGAWPAETPQMAAGGSSLTNTP
jgi:hypothetical protein